MSQEEKGFFQKLQKRWNVSATRAILILIVFAFTGTTVLLIKEPVLDFIIRDGDKTWIHTILYLILILPIYNILLLIYGFLFGQYQFFWAYEKKFFKRIFGRKKEQIVKLKEEKEV
jgi:hypothetical protein